MRSFFVLGVFSGLILLSSCGTRQDGGDAKPGKPSDQAVAKTDGDRDGHSSTDVHGMQKQHGSHNGHSIHGRPARRGPRSVQHDKLHGHAPTKAGHGVAHHTYDGNHDTEHSAGRASDHDKRPHDRHGAEPRDHDHQKAKHDHADDQRANKSSTDDFGDLPDELASFPATEIFNRRILPISRSGKASSCTECHFGGVDLGNFIKDDQATTFAALRDEGLIDVKAPDKSKLLTFIARRPDKEDELLAKVRRNEYQVFRAWIRAAVRDPDLLATKSTETKVGTELPVEVVRHMRRDRVLRSFVENIWSEMGRCINCHSPERNQRQVREHREQVSWIVPRDPAATLEELVKGGNIDTDHPEDSPLVLKPAGLQDHGGGPKFAVGSRTDKNYRRFLNDYAAVVNGKYKKPEQLPKPFPEVAVFTGQHLRIVDLPERFGRKLLKADLYRWTDRGWSETRVATAENPIAGKRQMWQSVVFAVAPRDSKRAEALARAKEMPLPAGRYLIKIYIDQEDKAKKDRDYELGKDEFYGQVETHGPWRPGYQPPKIVRAPTPQN